MRSLPEFDRPPVVEVAISLQFSPLDLLRSAHLGLLWQRFRSEGLVVTEDHGELPPAFEEFGAKERVSVRVQTFEDAPPLPRVWFLNEAKNELVQVQRDRLAVNWRKGAQDEPYPRYESVIGRFRSALDILVEFCSVENVGGILPTQCEMTYVNHIPAGEGWSINAEAGNVVTTWRNGFSDGYLPDPEDVSFTTRFRMADEKGGALGRLYVSFRSAYRMADKHPVFVLEMTARGAPERGELQSAFDLFGREHEWIVRGFSSITTREMHERWRRRDGGQYSLTD